MLEFGDSKVNPLPTNINLHAIEHKFSPYTDNGGTTVAVSGEDYAVVAADTRQSEGYSINTRYSPKAFKLSNYAVLGTGGFHADAVTLVKRIGQRLEWFQHQHEKPMSTPSIAQMLSIMLYHKRFFPFYVYNILGGLDENGKGCVYSYDPVGSFEREGWRAGGSGGSIVQPFLDNQFADHVNDARVNLPVESVVKIVKDAFTGAAERDIYTGDYLEIFIVTRDGVQLEKMDLKKD
ncbi:Proteasome subunit beta type-1 [Nowakowskiella sp. JEL0407]|nr:Proteasome subunit beta type-1 [Nowakowskiella sp. JEL0407]